MRLTRPAAVLVTIGVFPLVAGPAALNLANQIFLAGIAALALTLLMGTAGLISLGHAALLGAGGFTVGVLTQEFGAPIWVTLPSAILVGGGLGALAGLPSLRLRGVYLAVSTLALHFAVLYLASEYQTRRRLSTGIEIADPAFGPLTWYFVLVTVLTGVVALCRNLLRARTGRAWMALRERDSAASTLGVDVPAYKLAVFVVSAAMTSLAGALGAYYQHFVAVEAYPFLVTVQSIAMVLIGGVASIAGALAGAAFVVLLPQVVNGLLGALPVPAQLKLYVFAVQYALFGLLMAGFILFEPGGLISLGRRLAVRAPKRQPPGAVHALPGALTEAPALLEVSDLAVVYGDQATAVDGVSLRIPSGSMVAVLGPNGAGKTSTLRAITGFLSTESAHIARGDVRLAGVSVGGWSPERTARAGIVLVPERDKIFGTLTVEQNLAVTARASDAPTRESIFRYFPVLGQRRHVLAGYLSGGERQMLALGCALLCAPRVLVVDELSLGLAPALVQQLLRVLSDLRRELGLTVLLVEQHAAAALAVADYAYVLAAGRVVSEGLAATLLADPDFQALYLGSTCSISAG